MLRIGDELFVGVRPKEPFDFGSSEARELETVPVIGTVTRVMRDGSVVVIADDTLLALPLHTAQDGRREYLRSIQGDQTPPVYGVRYEHYKGDYYEPFELADWITPMVVYRSCSTRRVWTRPLHEWNQVVEWSDGTCAPRYRRCTSIPAKVVYAAVPLDYDANGSTGVVSVYERARCLKCDRLVGACRCEA